MKRPRTLFFPSLPPLEEPIRAEIFGIERLEQHAESLAAAQRVTDGDEPQLTLLPRVESNGRALREANRIIADAVRQERWITPAAEWLLDNFFIVDEQLREIRDDLPVGFYRELPALAEGHLAGFPRVYGIAWAFVAHTDSRFDPVALRRFVQAYQRVQPLTIGELWAVTISLRVVLVENLRRMADAIVGGRVVREEADALADEILGLSERGVNSVAEVMSREDNPRLVTEFAVELVQRLRDRDPAVTPALAWLHQRLAAQGTTADEIALVEHGRQAARTVTVRNIITSMRLISALDWTAFFESVSLVDEKLRASSTYSSMDFASRDGYRHAIEELARGSNRTELDVTKRALERSGSATDPRHSDPGFYLVGSGRREFERELGFRPSLLLWLRREFLDAATPGYLGALVLTTLGILAAVLFAATAVPISTYGRIVLGVFALIPASEIAIAILNRFVTTVVTPEVLPRLEWKGGVPTEFKTLVAVPTLLAGRADIDEQVERLEVHYLANSDGDVRFALVSDWPDAPTEHAPGDEEILVAARDGIARLNERYGPTLSGEDRFFLFHRKRLWNEREGTWMGWERKRGKLHELNRLLRGATDTTFLATKGPGGPGGAGGPAGSTPVAPSGVRYVVTLDSDTRLPIGAIHRLVGTMAHPQNRPRLDPESKRVVEGYAVLQPRVTPPLPGRSGSVFQRLCSGASGIDPYASAVSDVYQDLFAEGSYTGKGIYDVDAFEAALDGRVPENALLSHDLFEGVFARAGLVTDVELFESAPSNYLTAASRQHRWARGDWQLLPWILRERLLPIDRWKMIDNLRRTLAMATAYLTLALGWIWPGSSPAHWTAFVIAVVAVPAFLPAGVGVWPRVPGLSKRSHLRAVARDFRAALGQTFLTLTIMAHQAWSMIDAIVRTLWRLDVSHGPMLEWQTMSQAASNAPLALAGFYRRMMGGIVLALAAAVLVAWRRPEAWPSALPLLALWVFAPVIARFVSLPGRRERTKPLSDDEARELRLTGRRTWRYFETFVPKDGRALPPDNFQETPSPVIATRTSPTNIGLYLLSIVSARDFGWIGTLDAVDRLESTLRTIRGLEQHRGHLFNWYDTQDGRTLEPKYVSSVDSGNLAGCLLTLASACRAMLDHPVLGPSAIAGIRDALDLLLGDAIESGDGERSASVEHKRFGEALDVVRTEVEGMPRDLVEWAARIAELEASTRTVANCARDVASESANRSSVREGAELLRAAVDTHSRDLDTLLPWSKLRVDDSVSDVFAELNHMPTLAELPARCEAALREIIAIRAANAETGSVTNRSLRTVDALVSSLERAVAAASALSKRIERLESEARAMFAAMDFRLVFDSTRMLFSIGYRMHDGSLDTGRYDLLASEARILSFVAIAKGDVPVRHWFRLGRSLTPMGNDSVLLSWSGSMFEYLMPSLIMRTPSGSLLEQTCRLVVRRQIEYGIERGVPWGISESGYFVRDLEMTFQYSNFGVPGLGLRRGLGDDIVVAPYATALASMVEPVAAVENLRALASAGALGKYGYYDALDFTPERLPADKQSEVVRTFMAHHQGMTIVAISNVLNDAAMRARFHAEPMVRACELLLQERTPRDVAVARPLLDAATAKGDVRETTPPHTRTFTSPHGATPRTQLLSNGRYAVMVTAAGSGYSRWKDIAITRWREDATKDDTGSFIYLRDVLSSERWSAGYQPSAETPESYHVSFAEDRAEFLRRDGAIATRLEVIVSAEDDAEVRRVSLTNHGVRTREIEVTSYAEIVLASQAADAAHPAFSNLFVQTESVEDRDTLLATRRRRSPEESEVWLAHVIAVEGETIGDLEWETDREQFLGRGRGVRVPSAMMEGRHLSNTVGSVLDPILSLRRRVRVRPGKTVRVAFATLVASSRSAVLDLADKYHDVTTFERVATLAWTHAQVQMHHLGITSDEAHLFQTLGGSVLFVDRALRASANLIARRAEGVTSLWAHGISGDLPIVVVEIEEIDAIDIVRQLLRAHAYWRMKRLAVDLVILNARASSYLQELQTALETIVRTSQSMPLADGQQPQGRVFILRTDRLTGAQLDVLKSVSRIELASSRGSLAEQLSRAQRADATPGPSARVESSAASVPPPAPHPELEFFNGIGGFHAEGREYVTILRAGQRTPAPWINVLANPDFGALVSESGSGCTWSINSHENMLTAWSNDPVSDPPSDMLYIRDDDSHELWSPTPLPIRKENGEYEVRHGHGYTRFQFEANGIASDLLQFVPIADPLKVQRLTLTNLSSSIKRLTITGYLEWVLGSSRSGSAPYVTTEIDPSTQAMFARNSWSRDFGTRIAFADLGGAQTACTGDRTEFLGRNGALDRPAALDRRERLSGRSGAAFDPCCALQTSIEIAPGATARVDFVVGQAANRDEARELIVRQRKADVARGLAAVTDEWDRVLGTLVVKTPDRAFDLLVNQWLLYQTLSSRIWARSAFYQAGGAYGFRDQLQDVMAVLAARPKIARDQILRAAAHQFTEGDVLHWWHEPAGRGVRTRISDDLLWLPFVVHHYVETTADSAILDEIIPFLEGAVLGEGQLESYFEPQVSASTASLFEHCARAIDRSLGVGAHGLPKIGTGDWNDGMNRVGSGGQGESVWLAWFLLSVLKALAPIAASRGEKERAARWEEHANALKAAIEREGWDGQWYRRAYFDDGTPLGTAGAGACAIDSIAQSWSVLSGSGDPDRARVAMESVDRHLVRRHDGLILLLTPPFDRTGVEPGYIQGYVPGVRENGGQYTHAAIWAAIAFAELGDGDKAFELFAMLNPIRRCATSRGMQCYRVEPYVAVGDVYSEPPHVGRGGWTWYTGSAGWLYRAGTEWILGIRLRGDRLILDPCIPSNWPGFSATLRRGSARYEITVENGAGVCRGVQRLELDGVSLVDLSGIPFADDRRTHRVRVVLGAGTAAESVAATEQHVVEP